MNVSYYLHDNHWRGSYLKGNKDKAWGILKISCHIKFFLRFFQVRTKKKKKQEKKHLKQKESFKEIMFGNDAEKHQLSSR